ncbi:hypothetical protein [Erwinia psidii]|uniref:Uncharacterized protein n=1 Tax=Erwinia psidii TaxID=69224 RepID=A0A3N6UV07_9GAMM|nr:hypothetical protein [Erwinia psidii]MCX8959260.1 hypothetical protein [Erwinia psidii]MCX8962890.1 hypothetical protein [Erwinia psidii]MCX8966037.1 hypothetical protein [Erwinia psidii]RQM36685.1 hypothetical protein EB241_19110 [Erwinia psidii]
MKVFLSALLRPDRALCNLPTAVQTVCRVGGQRQMNQNILLFLINTPLFVIAGALLMRRRIRKNTLPGVD